MIEQWGKYQLNRLLATGGMAEVFMADMTGPSGFLKPVCLKRIRPEFSGNQEFVRMFESEARIAATLHHPNIVQVFDFDLHDDRLFLTMEIVDGLDLATILKLATRLGLHLPIAFSTMVMRGLFAALSYAHRQEVDGKARPVIHRDISPHNILISKDGIVKLVDFGIAKAKGLSEETQAGLVKGKVAYLSPEQARAKPLNNQTDLFSAGLVFYELLTNERAFRGRTDSDILLKIAKSDIPPISGVSDRLNGYISKITARAPADRFETAEEADQMIRELGLPEMTATVAGRLIESLAEYKMLLDAPSPLSVQRGKQSSKSDSAPDNDKESFQPGVRTASQTVSQPNTPPKPTEHDATTNDDASPILDHSLETPNDGEKSDSDIDIFDSNTRSSSEIPKPEFSIETTTPGRLSPKRAVFGTIAIVIIALAIWIAFPVAEPSTFDSPETAPPSQWTKGPAETKVKESDGKQSVPPVATLEAKSKTAPLPSPEKTLKNPPNLQNEPHSSPPKTESVEATVPAEPKEDPSSMGTGYLEIHVRPWAHVRVDGKHKGTTPLKKLRVKAGQHRVTLSNGPLAYKKSFHVKVRAGKTTSVNESISTDQ